MTAPPLKRSRWILLALALAGLLAVACGSYLYLRAAAVPDPPDAPEGVEPGVREAVRVARDAVSRSPRSAKAWGNLAETFLANELDDEGAFCAAVAERFDPRDPRWPYFRGGVLLNRGDREGALAHLRRAAEADEVAGQGGGAPALLFAEVLLGLGELDQAETQLRRVRDDRPDDVRARYDLGLLAAVRGDDRAARDQFLGCLDSPFTRRKARISLAAVCQRLDDGAAAGRFRAEAHLLPPDAEWQNPLLFAYLGLSVKKRRRYELAERLEAQGRFLEAARALEPLTASDPQDALAWLTMGKALAQAGQGQAAEASLRRALELAPHKVQARHYLGLHLFAQGEDAAARGETAIARKRFEESAELARGALAIKPDYGVAHFTLGLTLRRLGHRAEGLAALRMAVRCSPEHGEIHYRLGEALADDGLPEARERLERALLLAPPGAHWARRAKELLARLAKGSPTEAP